MIITIFASIGSQNLGDELILKNEIKILKNYYSKVKNISENEIFFKVFTYDIKNIFYKDKNTEYIEYFPIDIKNKKNIFRNIKNFINLIKTTIKSDLIVVGGGGIIYDNEIQSVGNPLKQWLFRISIFRLFRKKVEFFRIGINIKNNKNLFLIKKIFNKAEKISVRDNYSFYLLKKLNFKNIELFKDPVFYDNKNISLSTEGFNPLFIGNIKIKNLNVQKIKDILKQGSFNISGKKIGLALRYQKIDNYEKNIIEIIKYFLENKCTIYLIPHSFHKTDKLANDLIFLNNLKNSLNSDKISICKNMQESYEIYKNKKIDLNLASRLHSIILSQVYEIPFIAVSYSKKTDEVISLLSSQNQGI